MFIKTHHLLVCISLLLSSNLCFHQCKAGAATSSKTVNKNGHSATEETENEREFAYVGNPEREPKNWGKIHHEWAACENGKMQSPIDIVTKNAELKIDMGKMHPKYKPAPTSVKNRGHDIMVSWHGQEAGGIKINGSEFSLRQLHWHSPAEHTFDGIRHQMEVHLVHEGPKGEIAVIAMLYDYGAPDPLLATVIPHIAQIGEEDRDIGVLDPRGVKLPTKKYYRYIGSLTVPPCTEGVIWTLVKKVKTVSKEQVHILREAVHDRAEENSRPLQQNKGRKVWYYSHKQATSHKAASHKAASHKST